MGKVGGSVVAVALVVAGAVYLEDKYNFMPECFQEDGITGCLPDWLVNNPVADVGKDTVYTSNIGGGTVQIRTAELDWPLFDRLVQLVPFEIEENGDLAYSAKMINRVTTSMVGRVVSITLNEEGLDHAYIFGVDDKNTEDKTDDKLVPINPNKFKMVSRKDVDEVTYNAAEPEQVQEYEKCYADLVAGVDGVGGCILSGIDGHDQPIDATIINNLVAQYQGYDKDVEDTMKIASNVVLGNRGTLDWNNQYPETLNTSHISKVSIHKRMADVLNLPDEQVHAIFEEENSTGVVKPVPWEPNDIIDLSEVERLSGGKYHVVNGRVATFGANQGSWEIDMPAKDHIPGLQKIMGTQILDPEWLRQWVYVPEDYPKIIDTMISNADGKFSFPAAVGGPTTTQA